MLRYGERRAEKPDCYDREGYFNSNDPDCQRCDWCSECERRDRIRHNSVNIPINSYRSNMRNPIEAEPDTDAGIVKENETAGQRFFKDCLTGACRGAALEAYRFFLRFRF